MRSKKELLSHFSRVISRESQCFRPENEAEVADCPKDSLARGNGLSYSDCCFNTNGAAINTDRLNHLLSFDSDTGIVECQASVTFKDLFLVHPEFIPPVIPGTLYATVAGGIANDVHGKNNHLHASLGAHVVWIELHLGTTMLRCSREINSDLFYATIAGLGLTGTITRVAIKMCKASRSVHVHNTRYKSVQELADTMSSKGLEYDYQVAWLDLLNSPTKGILSLANHSETSVINKQRTHVAPKLPFSLIHSWNMKLFNKAFLLDMHADKYLSLEQFNNPLDSILHWNRLYGPKGLIQFQSVFDTDKLDETLQHLLGLIKNHGATPTLAVLKLFTKPGEGLLSFCKPGFTLAVDFKHNRQANLVIESMNQYICEQSGAIYLAKDLLLTKTQFQTMYPKLPDFKHVLSQYQCTIHSDLALRLGIK